MYVKFWEPLWSVIELWNGIFKHCLYRFSHGNAFLCDLERLSYAEKNWELSFSKGVHWKCGEEAWSSWGVSLTSLEVRTDYSNCIDLHLSSLSQLWGCFSGSWTLINAEQNLQAEEVLFQSPLYSCNSCHHHSAPANICQTFQALSWIFLQFISIG